MKGVLRIQGSIRVLDLDLEIDFTCESFGEVDEALRCVDTLKIKYPPTKEAEGSG